ncbi:hypothetical protein T265_09953 [Opisthorchis viverrini]|uniref:Uncharacterized protein n=1 Tax=Opisthorchis viverrini TaxID=6198 RepID=A0A074Z417_OPIVI|nr:hypothetical protein T265_09953 [Opisthorchis viverrini]KER21793.1 hypothetical protein T265_09953 [Opisthorchis viverrini]
MRRPGAAHSVAWKHHKREIQLGSRWGKQKCMATVYLNEVLSQKVKNAAKFTTIDLIGLGGKIDTSISLANFTDPPSAEVGSLTETRGLRLPDEP